jgi:hypothetical protein
VRARLLFASLLRRPRQLLLIQLAVLVAAATCSTVAGFAARGGDRLRADLRQFGPNLIVRPQATAAARLPLADLERVRAISGVAIAAGIAELRGEVLGGAREATVRVGGDGERALVFADAALARLYPRWELAGRWPRAGEVALGGAVALAAAATSGEPGPVMRRAVAGRLMTGESLDAAVFLPLADLETLAGGTVAPAGVDRIEVRAEAGRLEEVAAAIEARLAGAEARPLLSRSAADRALSRRLALLLGVAGALTLLLAALTVVAAAGAVVGERRGEIGLFLALGWGRRRVAELFAAELLAGALVAAVAGELVGEAAAAGLVRSALAESAAVELSATGLAAAAGGALAVVGVAIAAALRRLGRFSAAELLAGD